MCSWIFFVFDWILNFNQAQVKLKNDEFVSCICVLVFVSNWMMNFSQTSVKFENESLTLYMCSWIFLVFDWILNFSQTQVKLKHMSLSSVYPFLCLSFVDCWVLVTLKSNWKNEFDFVHVFLDWFLIEYWILVKLKSHLKNDFVFCICVLVLVFRWMFNVSQTQVRSNKMSLTLYMWSTICF